MPFLGSSYFFPCRLNMHLYMWYGMVLGYHSCVKEHYHKPFAGVTMLRWPTSALIHLNTNSYHLKISTYGVFPLFIVVYLRLFVLHSQWYIYESCKFQLKQVKVNDVGMFIYKIYFTLIFSIDQNWEDLEIWICDTLGWKNITLSYFSDLFPISSVPLVPNRRLPKGLPPVAWNPWNDLRWRDDIAALNISYPYGPMPDFYARYVLCLLLSLCYLIYMYILFFVLFIYWLFF